MIPLELYIAGRYIGANIRQSIIIGFAVGLGVSLIIFMPSVNLSFFNDILKKTISSNPHIRITRELKTQERNRDLMSGLLPPNATLAMTDRSLTRRRNLNAYRQLMAALEAWPGVVAVAPYITEQIIVTHGAQVLGGSLRGIDPVREVRLTTIEEDISAGNLRTLSESQVFLGWRLAEDLGVTLGQRVQLVTSQGARSFKVAGLLKTGVNATDQSAILVSLNSAQTLLNMPSAVTGVGVRLADVDQAEVMAQSMARTFHLKTRSWMAENRVFLEQRASFRVIMSFINFLIVFASASSITSVLIMVVASKSREIGILKAMGAQPGTITRLFIVQALFLSVLGAGLGVLGGLGWIWLYNVSPFSKAETLIGTARKPVTISLEFTYIAVFFALLSSTLASLIPAWQASRLDPVKAIAQQ